MTLMSDKARYLTIKKIAFSVFLTIAFLSLFLGKTTNVYAVKHKPALESKTALKNVLAQYVKKILEVEEEKLKHLIEDEQENLKHLTEQLIILQNLQETVKKEIDDYNLQVSMHSKLLMLPSSKAEDLEKAKDDHYNTLYSISSDLVKLWVKRNAVYWLRYQTEEKYKLTQDQLAKIKSEQFTQISAKERAIQFETLVHLVSNQLTKIEQILEIYPQRIHQLEKIQQSLAMLTGRFDEEISIRNKPRLFKKNISPLAYLGLASIKEERVRIAEQIALVTTLDFWAGQARAIWVKGWFSFFMFLAILILLYVIFIKIRRYLTAAIKHFDLNSHRWTVATLGLVRHSLPLMGMTIFFYSYARVRLIFPSVPITRVVIFGLLTLLLCRWASDGIGVLCDWDRLSHLKHLKFRLKILIIGVQISVLIYIIVFWMIGESSLLFLARVFLELILFLWIIYFLRAFRAKPGEPSDKISQLPGFVVPIVVAVSYTISVGGILLEFAGYSGLALYWYISWGQSLVVLMWAILLFLSLVEWKDSRAETPIAGQDDKVDDVTKTSLAKWLLLWLSWLSWATTLLLALIFAWGSSQAVLVGFFRLLSNPIQIGNIELRLIGFIYANIILLCTHAAARLLRRLLRNRILLDSGLDLGLQESVTTITIYLFWGLGILLSLNAIGLSTTSITVAFGALSIGLGFGLQNIFSNFVSGLILLFERPVQVGDVVQINNIWGTVAKINVRSTIVQTYDNASLIIPNADMISNQVTNWSFKDQRLRRNIVVGVAYGSDIKLVHKTLLEIANDCSLAIKTPEPDVLFKDFGDSTLVFELRIWTTIHHFAVIGTDIRFAIDRLFRERNIEIAFPQRDIHIRSTVEKVPTLTKTNTEEE